MDEKRFRHLESDFDIEDPAFAEEFEDVLEHLARPSFRAWSSSST